MGYSAPSPKGRYIEHVEGHPEKISGRGEAITKLGEAMEEASKTLHAAEQGDFNENLKGKYADKLKEGIGESWKALGEAADLYKPVGPVLVKYGDQLGLVQNNIDNTADDCEELWAKYESLDGDKDGSTTPEEDGGFLGIGGHDADSPEAKKEAEDNQAKLAAYQDWHDKASAWDSFYDTWEDAFDEATAGITDGTGGKIKDGFMEYFDNFVEILEVVALVVGVLALFLAGPFAAIALALAAAVLIAKTIQAANGHAKWSDVAWAAVDILPFGKIGKLGKLAGYVDEVKAAKTGAGKLKDGWDMTRKVLGDGYPDAKAVGKFQDFYNAGKGVDGNLIEKVGGGAKAAWNDANPSGMVDLVSRNFAGMNTGDFSGTNFNDFGTAVEAAFGAGDKFQSMASIPGSAAEKVFGQDIDFDAFNKDDVGTEWFRPLNFL
ncbi:MAG: hypothetical protein ACRDSJ_25260 [Rubrobacteraceae bacterium]